MLPIYYETHDFKTQCKIIVKILIRFSIIININFTIYRILKIQMLSTLNSLRQFVTFFELVFYLNDEL
jgi:hypothetical protein